MSLKGLFIKSEADETKTSAVGGSSIEPPLKIVSEQNRASGYQEKCHVPGPVAAPTKSIMVDEDMVGKIWDKIIESNRPGPDYLELKNNVEALEDLPISNEQKLLSAFKVLKKSYPNFTKDDIVKAIDFYISIVNGEKENGMKQLSEMKSVGVDKVEAEIEQMNMQAEELKKKYDELQRSITDKNLELTKAKNEIENMRNVFTGSVNAVMDVLEGDKKNIMSTNF